MIRHLFLVALVPWFLGVSVQADPAGFDGARDVTIVPSPPVTDRGGLDLRVAVPPGAGTVRVEAVLIAEDGGAAERTLGTVDVLTDAKAPRLARLRAPLDGAAGRRRLRVVLRGPDGREIGREERPLEVRSGLHPAPGYPEGGVIDLRPANAEETAYWHEGTVRCGPEAWGDEIVRMRGFGLRTVVVQAVALPGAGPPLSSGRLRGDPSALIPLKCVPRRAPGPDGDPVEAILRQADASGLSVFLGVGVRDPRDISPDGAEWRRRVSTELWDRYGKHASFYGWSVPDLPSLFGVSGEASAAALADLAGHLRTLAPAKPVLAVVPSSGMGSGEGLERRLAESGADILLVLDGRGSGPHGSAEVRDAFGRLGPAAAAAGVHLWAGVEPFEADAAGRLAPAAFTRLREQIDDVRPHAERIVLAPFTGLLSVPARETGLTVPAGLKDLPEDHPAKRILQSEEFRAYVRGVDDLARELREHLAGPGGWGADLRELRASFERARALMAFCEEQSREAGAGPSGGASSGRRSAAHLRRFPEALRKAEALWSACREDPLLDRMNLLPALGEMVRSFRRWEPAAEPPDYARAAERLIVLRLRLRNASASPGRGRFVVETPAGIAAEPASVVECPDLPPGAEFPLEIRLRIPPGQSPGPATAKVRIEEQASTGEWIELHRIPIPFTLPTLAFRRTYTLSRPPDAPQDDAGGEATDGRYAGGEADDGRSFGWSIPSDQARTAEDLVLDLGETRRIESVRAVSGAPDRYRPDRVTVATSTDGESWAEQGEAEPQPTGHFTLKPAVREARYVRFRLEKERKGEGEVWMVIDEVEVY